MPKESPTKSYLCAGPKATTRAQPPALHNPTVPISVAAVALPGWGEQQHDISLLVLCLWMASQGSQRRAAVDDIPSPKPGEEQGML